MRSDARRKLQALTNSVRRERNLKRKAQALAVMANIPQGSALVAILTRKPACSNVHAIAVWLDDVPGSESLSLPVLRDALIRQLSDGLEVM